LSHSDTSDPRFDGYWPSERRAILVHRFYLGIESKRWVSIPEAIASWESGPGCIWRATKAKRDGEHQRAEIARHKWILSKHSGRDVGWDCAAEDWVVHHAAAWRRWWEQQPEAGA